MTASPKVRGEPAKDAAAARAATPARHLIAMTREPVLAHSLQELAGNGLGIHIVEDLRQLADELMQRPTAVALLDAQSLGVPADAAVDAVNAQFPDVRVLVAGHATEQNLLASRISQQKVFRFVHKPASPQRLQLLIDAAHAQHQEQRGAPAAAATAAGGASPPPRRAVALLPLAGAAVLVATLALGAWLLLREEAPPATVVAAPAPVVTPTDNAPQLQGLLQRAAQALEDGHLIAADGSSAAEIYREALRLDADNSTAIAGFERAIEQSLAGAEQALLAGRLDEARVTAELLRLIVPENSRLAFLYSQIGREQERVNANITQRQAYESRQGQIRAALEAVELRIAAGALVEPATDSALSRFREAEAIGGGDPLVRAGRDTLVGALLTAADRALDGGRTSAARTLVEAAGSVNSSAPGLDIVRRRLETATTTTASSTGSSAAVTAPAGPAITGTAAPAAGTEPAPEAAAQPPRATPTAVAGRDSAAGDAPGTVATTAVAPAAATAGGGATAGGEVVSARTLRVRRQVDPEFPRQALDRLVSGWVEMEFTVATDGSVRDVEVIAAEPERTFDAAATAAMRRYQFAPVLRDGQPIEQRARLRMRFTAEDGR